MPTTTTHDDLEEAQAMEQYGHPLAELTSERYSIDDVLRDRHRRANPRPPALVYTPQPDPKAAEHYAVLEAAIAGWTYRPSANAQ
ncbi:hypothetical protein [Streptomyces sp. G-G2]|uniref:hypothetical protein n=1 Tax=Streptomyces sp. G-G2 TaxID=3046201 RepID=UPI0024B9B772|nr:hypothetical protein [Streptomyces sp. G-G2]MDJ0383243.1 hypothetical protein [Streptomyces sp. G-G2]